MRIWILGAPIAAACVVFACGSSSDYDANAKTVGELAVNTKTSDTTSTSVYAFNTFSYSLPALSVTTVELR